MNASVHVSLCADIPSQVRCAKNLDEGIYQQIGEMQKLKQFYIFDNVYFVGMGNEKLGREYAITALQMLEHDGGLAEDSDWSSKRFMSHLCKPLRVVELWERAQVRKFGHVAAQSPAFHKVVALLKTKSGLQKVLSALPGPLHGKGEQDKGIEECFYMVQAMERCKAGGHGPPTSVPTSSEAASGAAEANAEPGAGESPADLLTEVTELEAVANSLCVPDGASHLQAKTDLIAKAQASDVLNVPAPSSTEPLCMAAFVHVMPLL